MADDLSVALRAHFGFGAFRAGQREAIEHLLAGRHTLAVMPTGAGKSLVYQLAGLRLPGLTLVLSPLIALMKDQVDSLTRRNIPATFVNSTLPAAEQDRRLHAIAEGAFRLAYVAPERLRSAPFQDLLRHVTVSLLAVDEAHCLSQWGHDFRPDYLHIAAAHAQMGRPVIAALTATATPRVQADIVRLLSLPSAARVITGFNRPNLAFEVRYTADLPAKLRALHTLLGDLHEGGAIVYVGTRREAEEVAEFLRDVSGLEAGYYHAGLQPETRARIQEDFVTGYLPVVVATNAFGMGIDRPDVRLVVHFALTGTLEAYYQEAGRAGRDGQDARAALLYSPQDRALQEWFIENDAPSVDEVRSLFESIQARSRTESWATSETISLLTGLPEIKVKVGLSQLEMAGAVQRLGDEGARMLLRPGAWNEAAIRAAAGDVEQRRCCRRAQLAQAIAYAETNACRRRILLDHFGDDGPAEATLCCDNCAVPGAEIATPATNDVSNLSYGERAALIILDALRRLRWGVGPVKLAQVLKGSRAKEMHRFRYDQNPYYGRLGVFSLREIEGLVEQLVAEGYLKVIGGEWPVLSLTPQGERALKARASIQLHLPRAMNSEAIGRKQAERDAGGTVALTAQMFAEGLSPTKIAVRRGLSETTIYKHLSQLIGEGAIPLAHVVPDITASEIRAAIMQVGHVSALAPIKARLPDDVSYGHIQCVAAAWSREQAKADRLTQTQQAIIECVHSLPGQLPRSGVAKLLVGSPSARVEHLKDNRFYGALAGRYRDEVMREVDNLIHHGHLALDDHGKVTAGKPARATGNTMPRRETGIEDDIVAFLKNDHPRPLGGPWEAGWALGFHSRFAGATWSRSPVGELAHRLKYQGDQAALRPLVEQAWALCAEHPELAAVDALVPVSPSTARAVDPVGALAAALGRHLQRPVCAFVAKTRRTRPQKELRTLAQKRANVAGAFTVRENVRGKKLLILDDLYDSGATLEEVCRVLHRAGAASLFVLTMTRTIHTEA